MAFIYDYIQLGLIEAITNIVIVGLLSYKIFLLFK